MYAALLTCWMPPPKDAARHGMEYTVRFAFKRDGKIIAPPHVTYSSHDAPAEVRNVYRDAVNAALVRCTPLHFSDRMADAVPGRPIAIRFVDNRTIDGKSGPLAGAVANITDQGRSSTVKLRGEMIVAQAWWDAVYNAAIAQRQTATQQATPPIPGRRLRK